MNGWSEALRQELQPDVRVIVIEPGAVATELPQHITHGETEQGVEQLYADTAIPADDIAQIIAFAVSRCASRMPTEAYDFSGKTVHPVTTHAMSGLGTTRDDYARSCRGARIGTGLAVRGEQARSAHADVDAWLRGAGFSLRAAT
jgi:hypothetical protein